MNDFAMSNTLSTKELAQSPVPGLSFGTPAPSGAGLERQKQQSVQQPTNMKQITVLLALGAAVALMPSAIKAQSFTPIATPGIANTAHNFYNNSNYWVGGLSGLAGKTPNVCGECHDVHKAPSSATGGGGSLGPLWVHAPSAQTYVTYASAGSETFNALGVSVVLGDSSLACLSCHDGTVGINQQVKLGMDGTLNATATTLGNTNGTGNGLVLMPAGNILAVGGNDLTHVHPIGISYDACVAAFAAAGLANELNPKTTMFGGFAGGEAISAQLKGPNHTQMECSTCHDIHNTRPISSSSMHGQALCMTCHNK
jgi:predicted CXXCH cytochrome family protein